MVDYAIIKNIILSFLGSKVNESKDSLHIRFGKGKNFYLAAVVIRFSHESLEYFNGCVVAEDFVFEMEPHVLRMGNKLKTLIYFVDNLFSLSYCHHEGPFTTEEGQTVFLWVLEVKLDEASLIPRNRIDSYIYGVRISSS